MAWTAAKELRSTRRVSADLALWYRVGDAETGDFGESHRAKTTNVSCVGLAFVSKFAISISARLKLEVFVPGRQDTLTCEGLVVRIIRELPEKRGIEYGVALDQDTLTQPGALDEFVRSIDVVPLLRYMRDQNASIMHLTADMPPVLRMNRRLTPSDRHKPLSPKVIESVVLGTMSSTQREQLAAHKELDFPLTIPGEGRWRSNAFHQRGGVEATFHAIDPYVPTLAELGLPEVVRNIALHRNGLILVTGGPGSGKTTTIAAMIGVINNEEHRVVVSLEDPSEYIHQNDRSIIKQREIGTDAKEVGYALRSIIRQDPDVIVVDSITDAESMEMLLRAAESGFLVIAGLPTGDPMSTIQRVVRMFPERRRSMMLHMIGNGMRAIITQRLVSTLDGLDQVMALEIMSVNDSIRQAIWTDKLEQLITLMQATAGCQLLDVSLRNLIFRGQIDIDTACHVARDPEALRRHVSERRA
jgi:twitching motility protein PilT